MTFSTGLLYEIEASGKEELEKKRLEILEQTIKEESLLRTIEIIELENCRFQRNSGFHKNLLI